MTPQMLGPYDGLNRVIKITHPDNTFSQTLYGANVTGTGVNTSQLCSSSTYGLGFPILSIDESGRMREIWVDGFGRTIEGDEPDSSSHLTSYVCYSYDSLGNLLQVVRSGTPTQTRTYAYDPLSRVTSVTIPERANSSGSNCAITFTYDANSNLKTKIIPAPNQNTSCTSGAVTITYFYDALNRLTSKTYSDSYPTVEYFYDGTTTFAGCPTSTTPPTLTDSNAKGRMTAMCDSSGATSWAHDAAGRSITEKRTILGTAAITQTISYVYNLDGSVASINYPSAKQVAYTISNAQRQLTAKDPATGGPQFALMASYAPMGALQSTITGQVSGGFGGVTESHTFNKSMEFTRSQATTGTSTPMDLSFNYASSGDNESVVGILNNTDHGRDQTLTYDPLNRILSVVSSNTTVGNPDCWGQTFGPDGSVADDPLANLAVINTGTQAQPTCKFGSLNVSVDANNHLTGTFFGYDAVGNMLGDGQSGVTYTFNDENRLIKATPTGGPYCYVYDGNGLRVAKIQGGTGNTCTGGTYTKLYWRSLSGDSLAETDGSGSTSNAAYNEYVFFAGHRIASRTGAGSIFYFFADQIGTIRTVTTGSGAGQTPGQLCYDADFSPYGQEMQHTERLQTIACPPNYRFTGYEYDSETQLHYAFARYYSARLGRFLSTDPLGGSIGNLQSHNAYSYVLNNGLNLTDPTGLVPCIETKSGSSQTCRSEPGIGIDLSCTIDGVSSFCDTAFQLMDQGAAVPCPSNYCGIGSPTPYQCLDSVCGYFGMDYVNTHRNSWGGLLYTDSEWSDFLDDEADGQRQALADAISWASNSPDGSNWDYIYDHLDPYKKGTDTINIQGGNVDFTWTGDPRVLDFVANTAWATLGCTTCRYGGMNAIHYDHSFFHLDTASPLWGFGLGAFLHGFVDLFMGNINPSVPIRR